MRQIFIRLPEVLKMTGLSRTGIYKMMAANPPEFPQRVQLTKRSVAWMLDELEAWVASRQRVEPPSLAPAAAPGKPGLRGNSRERRMPMP